MIFHLRQEIINFIIDLYELNKISYKYTNIVVIEYKYIFPFNVFRSYRINM